MNPIQKILISCSAAVEDIIERPQCRADAKRHAMVGAFVLLTAVFAFASGAFAVYTGFKSLPLAILIGFAWALMIFTVDRFIVSGIRKSDVSAMKFAERWKTHAREFLITLPRIALAGVISLVIVTPLELRFFEREIDARIAETQLADLHRATATIDTGFTGLQELQAKNKELREEIRKAQVQYQNANELKIQELAGISGTRHMGPGPVFQQRVEQANKLLNDWQTTEQKNNQLIQKNNSEIDRLEKNRESIIVARRNVIAKSDGFLARFEALGELAATHPKIGAARLFMTLLFLCIELTPVLTKMLFARGAYDEILDTIEHKVRVEQLKERSDLNDDAHADVILHSLRNQRRIAAEEELTRAMSDLDVLTQSAPVEYEEAKQRIAKITIQEWVRNQAGPRPPRIPIRTP
jgi:hypothetical protein